MNRTERALKRQLRARQNVQRRRKMELIYSEDCLTSSIDKADALKECQRRIKTDTKEAMLRSKAHCDEVNLLLHMHRNERKVEAIV